LATWGVILTAGVTGEADAFAGALAGIFWEAVLAAGVAAENGGGTLGFGLSAAHPAAENATVVTATIRGRTPDLQELLNECIGAISYLHYSRDSKAGCRS